MIGKKIQIGAEAEIILYERKNWIFKDRKPKSYRLNELDEKIRKLRTRSEIKLLEKASKIIPVPKPIFTDSHDQFRIILPLIEGSKLSESLDDFPLKKQKEICQKIGENIAKLHDSDIIHGDLTTSNMIYVGDSKMLKSLSINNNSDKKGFGINSSLLGWVGGNNRASASKNSFVVFLIDFGLGFISRKIEDKAVDLHLLREALESKHFKCWKELFDSVISGYKYSKNFNKTFQKHWVS